MAEKLIAKPRHCVDCEPSPTPRPPSRANLGDFNRGGRITSRHEGGPSQEFLRKQMPSGKR